MDEPHNHSSQSAEIKNVLPDVVHSQQIPALAGAASVETESAEIATNHTPGNNERDAQETSETESISEHIPSKVDDSITESENVNHIQEPQGLLKVETEQDKVSKTNSLNIPYTYSPISENPSTHDPSRQSSSWPIDVNAVSEVHHISNESPVNLALSSDFSKEGATQENKSQSVLHTPLASDNASLEESPRSDKYVDSLNEESIEKSLGSEDNKSLEQLSNSLNEESLDIVSSGSEEIIKLDIRGQGVPKFPMLTAKIIFGPPPEGSTILDPNIEPFPVFPNLLSPFLVGAGEGLNVEEVFGFAEQQPKDLLPEKSLELSPEKSIEISLEKSLELSPDKQSFSSDKSEQKDLLVEELTVDDVKEKLEEKEDEPSMPTQPKSIPPEEMSFSTMTTDYKTICEEYHTKLVHLEDAITQRDELIEELTVSFQRSVRECDELRHENEHLANEVHQLQHVVGERSSSDHDTIKAQLSDFVKYQSMVNDSTKFYSALMSGGSSIQSSNGEKDMENEEITVNYSKSDLRSSGSEEFETGFESKLATIINKFDEYIEENLRNKLRESVIQVLCDEIGKMRLESDTEVKELEARMQQEKQGFAGEARRLRELLASVKAGNADIDALRQELSIKHEKEMENLRMYFEKKCSDMERSYSEEVWRGRACLSAAGSASSLEADAAADAAAALAAGDHARRRTRSADLPSLSLESTPLEQAVKKTCKKYDQQIEDLKAEHLAYINDLQARHAETIASFEEQITRLKAHIQTSENTEANVSLYQQDIDLELEKTFERRVELVRREVVQQLQEQIQVLLSDPDAEVSSWPVELVALRDKIHGDAARQQQEKELSSLRDELSGGEDKWKQRRNLSFDQNRHLEEVTKERDGLKRVAVSLHRVVGQLVAYCASAEDELNRTVLAHLLARVLPNDSEETFAEEESRPSTPNASTELDKSLVSKHVHFAPDLHSILSDLDEEGVVTFLQQQRDLSADIKRELESSLKRLRQEAHDLLDLSSKLGNKSRNESKMLESSQVHITELVHDLDTNQESCNNCELHRKNMEEAMAECLQRENLLRSDLEAAMIKIAHLMTNGDQLHSTDLIAEGYGIGQPLHAALSSTARASPRARCSTPGSVSLDGCASPRAHVQRMAHDLDLMQKERDDLEQQLEAANRQLRSTRAFVEEQAAEREAERDEYVRRTQDLRDDNTRLAARLQNNARILGEVEQLEAQTREMNQIINDLESRKAATDDELKATEEKIALLRDIIANLETQLEQKSAHEAEILEQLETMKKTIDERDGKMRSLLGELESLRSERLEQSDVVCVKCGSEEDKYGELMEKVKEQCRWVEERIHRRTQRLERVHEVCSASCSEPSEDVSLRDQRDRTEQVKTPESPATPRNEQLAELAGVWDSLQAHARAEQAALKRLRDLEMQRDQLKDIAQEVRAERDVLQARMSEQALKISSLSARLQQHRNDAEALAHHASSQLSVQLHDALAEVQKLKEDLESKDKQLQRLKQNLDEKDKLNEQHQSLYGNSCNPKDKVVILERELSSAQSRIAQLEALTRSLEADKDELHTTLRDHQRALAEKEEQLQELLALKLEDDNQKDRSEGGEGGKASARTLSDIVSISEFDEQDLQMRRAELRHHNLSLTGAPYASESRDKILNRTLPPDLQRPNMSSLHIEYIDAEVPSATPRADSLPAHLTSTQNKDIRYKRNVNETTMFGMDKFGECLKHSAAQNIPDNCSMYPNRDVSDNKDLSVEPKKINFSVEPSNDNRTQDEEFTSLGELGISLDIRQENFPDILTQLKHEIKKSRSELENCKSELKNAEEQLCEFPALKEEVEELKGLLENTMATMETDKKFYENQLENFSSNKKLLEQRLAELTQEVGEKSKDLHLLKEDILRRENMILELAKEKRNLTNKMAELEVKIDELQSRNSTLEKCENENHQMREKLAELQRLEQLVSEKNHQIDSLNQHLDRLDDLQRCLNDKTEEFENLKEAFEEKSNELFQMQDTVESLNRDIARLTEDNSQLNNSNKDLKLRLSKLEKEQENASLKLQNSETELERVNSLNEELTSKIDELKLLTDKLKDKETEIEILHEDINSFHEEIASLKEQLKISRSPSPRSKEGKRTPERAGSDKKQLVKIRKQISLLQHELDFNKKELNDKAFELAKAKLDVTELKNSLGLSSKQAADKQLANNELAQQLQQLAAERQQLADQLHAVSARLREESNVSELKAKLQDKVERCQELEAELQDMRELVDRLRAVGGEQQQTSALVVSGSRSPTAELERALRDQLNYSHTLDEDIMDQILSASSDDREDIPRLALNTSKSSSSIHSSSSDRLNRLRVENDKLQMQVNNLELRLKDKDALIAELNRIRDKLVNDWQTSKLRYEAERDNASRLQLLLHTHKECAESLQTQDSNMIQILKKRLESAMSSEVEMQQQLQQQRSRVAQLERQLLPGEPADDLLKTQLQHELENNESLRGEISVLKSKLELERSRCDDARAALEHERARAQAELAAARGAAAAANCDLADVKRLKHDASVELLRAKELLGIQSETISELEKKLVATSKQRPFADTLTEIETHKTELAREMATLKKCLADSQPGLASLRADRDQLAAQLLQLQQQQQQQHQQQQLQQQPDERDQAVRYLHGRCLRLESCRKALVWQKRYLQRVLLGYTELERSLRLPAARPAVSGLKRFKCVALSVVVTLRMRFLVRRRAAARALSAGLLHAANTSQQCQSQSPLGRSSGDASRDRLAHALPRRALRLHLPASPASPAVDDFVRRSPFNVNSPHNDPFILSSPRGEAAAYLNKLELVSRCLSRAMDPAP